MKLIELVRPINRRKKKELESRLEDEKRRLNGATHRAAETIQHAVFEKGLIRSYPIESAIALILGGYFIARKIQDRRKAS